MRGRVSYNNGMVGGPTIGFYTIGIFMPFISEMPAVMGLVSGLGVSVWVFAGQQQFPPGPVWTRPMEQTVELCDHDSLSMSSNHTISTTEHVLDHEYESSGLMGLYHMSYCQGLSRILSRL